MGTVVLFAAFLLAASANPIANPTDSPWEDTSNTDNEQESSFFTITVSTPTTEASTEDSSKPSEDGNSTSATTVSTSSTEHHSSEVHVDESSGNGENNEPSSSPFPEDKFSTDADEHSSETSNHDASRYDDNTTPHSNPLPQDTSTNETEVESELPSSTQDSRPPPDDDPTDCNVTDGKNHVYLQCQFLCSGDQMETAPENASCYLDQTRAMSESLGVRSRTGRREEGICKDGVCVPRNLEASTTISTPEISTTIATFENIKTTSTSETSMSTLTSPAPTDASLNMNSSDPVPAP